MDIYEIKRTVGFKLADIYENKLSKLTTVSAKSQLYGWIISESTLDLEALVVKAERRSAANQEGRAIHNALLKFLLTYQELMIAAR